MYNVLYPHFFFRSPKRMHQAHIATFPAGGHASRARDFVQHYQRNLVGMGSNLYHIYFGYVRMKKIFSEIFGDFRLHTVPKDL